jgi:antitoxin HicB
MNNLVKELKKYMELPYTVMLQRDEEGDIIARIKELEGCVADGQDEIEAIGNLNEVKEYWLHAALKAGRQIPLPDLLDEDLPSGKWLMRVPRTLHKKLAQLAEREGVSLNQFALACLAESVGEKLSAVRSKDVGGTLDRVNAAIGQSAYRGSAIHIVSSSQPPSTALEQEHAQTFLLSTVRQSNVRQSNVKGYTFQNTEEGRERNRGEKVAV